jgi:hypothetical protein
MLRQSLPMQWPEISKKLSKMGDQKGGVVSWIWNFWAVKL